MTNIVIEKRLGSFIGVKCEGHSGYAEEGSDIVCAAISVLLLNTANSIEAFTDTKIVGSAEEEGAILVFEFPDGCDEKATLLMNAMILGLQSIRKNYGEEFLKFDIKEV